MVSKCGHKDLICRQTICKDKSRNRKEDKIGKDKEKKSRNKRVVIRYLKAR
jgi:hypothetical protein